jgi:hypothetical protein
MWNSIFFLLSLYIWWGFKVLRATHSKCLPIYIFAVWQQVLPLTSTTLQCLMFIFQFILLALWPIRACFALSLFIFLASHWLNVLLYPISSGGRSSSKRNWRVTSVTLATFQSYKNCCTTCHPLPSSNSHYYWRAVSRNLNAASVNSRMASVIISPHPEKKNL